MRALERSRTSALVLAEGPLVEPLAAVAQGFFGTDSGGGYEPVQGHADVEDHLGHWSLLASLFVNRVLERGQRPQATRMLTASRTSGSNGLAPRTSTLVRVAPAIRHTSPRAASPERRGTRTPTALALSSAPTTYLNHCPTPMVANISTIGGSPNTLANPAIANMIASRVWSAHRAMVGTRIRVALVDGVWTAVPVSLIVSSSPAPSSRLLASGCVL